MIRLILAALAFAPSVYADSWVNGYTRRDGTYVQGHMRSDSNGSTYDNYSARGNTNPYTGQSGTKDYNNDYNAYGTSKSIYDND